MKLDIDRQDHGRTELDISGTLSLEMGEGSPEYATMEGVLLVDNLESRFLLNGTLKATGNALCGRCLATFAFVWKVPVEIMVLLRQERNQDPFEGQGKTHILHQSRGEVDLESTLIECSTLAYPISTVCREDCQGICASCGIDRNKQSCNCKDEEFDPRWAALDNLES